MQSTTRRKRRWLDKGQQETSSQRYVVFFIPGLGQLVQGRPLMALVQFVLAALLWIIVLGWIVHIWSIIDAAVWKP